MVESGRLIVAAAILGGLGTTLLVSEMRWFRRVSLAQRLSPFAGSSTTNATPRLRSFRDALAPLTTSGGARIAQIFGVSDDLTTRLTRAGLNTDVAQFRLRQFAWASVALIGALLVTLAVQPPLALCALLIAGAPLLAFLVLEQQVVAAAQKQQRHLFNELPVLTEQLAMLLSAGFSLNSALNRIAERNEGVGGKGLRHACDRVRHGLTTNQALREWADVMSVPELHRVVSVLALSGETSDLGRLVSDEAKAIRREAQRHLSETIEKRSQQVWIPVTVATLVPGVIFLVIPFLQALRLFSGN